jgi:predicted membrane protein
MGHLFEQVIEPKREGYRFIGWFTWSRQVFPDDKVDVWLAPLDSHWERIPDDHPFTDTSGSAWYADAVQFMYNHNLMQGTSATIFSPAQTLSRAQVATILHRMAGEPAVTFQPVFSDVPSTAPAWYRNAVIWANEQGIVQGSGGRFNPYGEITREQFAAMLHRYAQLLGVCTNVPEFFNLNNFQDWDEISGWAEPYMDWAVFHELIQGVNSQTLAPGGTATRAQSAAIFMRFLERLADGGFFI